MTGSGAPIEELAQAFVVADGTPGTRLFKDTPSMLAAPPSPASSVPTAPAIGSGAFGRGSGSRNALILVGIGILVLSLIGGVIAFASGGTAHHPTSAERAIPTVPAASTTTIASAPGAKNTGCEPGTVCSTATSMPCATATNFPTATTQTCNTAESGCPTRSPGTSQTTNTSPCVGAPGGCGNATTTTACGSPAAGCGPTTTVQPQGTTTTGVATTTTTAPQCLAVTSVSPNQGGAGQQVTVTGCGFTSATSVTFGPGRTASFVVNADTSITAIVPAGPSGTQVDVQVTTSSGTTPISSADKYLFV
jgi:hypothetical protein